MEQRLPADQGWSRQLEYLMRIKFGACGANLHHALKRAVAPIRVKREAVKSHNQPLVVQCRLQ